GGCGNRWRAGQQTTLTYELLQELLAAKVPEAMITEEQLPPLAIAEVANQGFVKQDLLEPLQVDTAYLDTSVARLVEDVGGQGVLRNECHYMTSRSPSSKNPPGHAFTRSPRSLRGMFRIKQPDPSRSTNHTLTSEGPARAAPSGSVPSEVSRIRRISRRSRCSLCVSIRNCRPCLVAASRNMSPRPTWSAGCTWISGCSTSAKPRPLSTREATMIGIICEMPAPTSDGRTRVPDPVSSSSRRTVEST